MPSNSPALTSRFVNVRSSRLGVGSPLGWLCYVASRVMWSHSGDWEKHMDMRESWTFAALPHCT